MQQEEILQLIKSNSLVTEINQREFKFTDLQLVRIIYDYAHTYEQRLHMLSEIMVTSQSQQACELAEKSIRYQMDAMTSFMAPQADVVYELHICDDPNAYEERYLCRTYEAALQLFHNFHSYFECLPNEDGRYWIVSRKFVDGNTADNFSEDEVGVCCLTKDCEVLDVDVWDLYHKDCDRSCENCERICLDNVSLDYPNFLENYDAVQFCGFRNKIHFGIFIMEGDCILPLDSEYAEYGDYKNINRSHEHIDPPFIEKIDVSTLNDEFRKRYDLIVAYLRKNALW